jgi:hypothetical protein
MSQENGAHPAEERSVDPLLRLFTHRANKKGLELEITLEVGGLLISGYLTGVAKYCEKLEAQMSEGLARIDPTFNADEVSDEEPATALPMANAEDFIHLRDAWISGLRSEPAIQAPVWRGRLSSVDAFVLGLLEDEQAETAAAARPVANGGPEESPAHQGRGAR